MGVLCCTFSSTACIWITKTQIGQQIAYVTYMVQRCLSSANLSIKTGCLSNTRYFFWYCFDVSTGVHLHYLSSKGTICICGTLYSILHNVVSLILWFFQSSIITEQSRFTLYIFFAQVIHITWIIGSCAHFSFSYCVWIAYTSNPFWTRISTQSSTYFECKNFGEEQDGTFLKVFFHYFRDGVPLYFTCLVSDGAVFCSSYIMQCVHLTQRTVLNRALASQSRWVRRIFDQFYSIIWLLSGCIGMTAFNFVSSLLIRSHYVQFNTRLRRWEILMRDTEYVYRAASHFVLIFSTSNVWCARISAFYEQDCLRSILRWGGLYFRVFISS